MKKIIRVASSSLKPGEMLAQDIYEGTDLLVKGGVYLSKEQVDLLKKKNIAVVNIFSNPERELVELKYDEVLERGLQYAVSGFYREAEVYFGFALRKDKSNIEANLYKGVTLLLEEKYAAARQRLSHLYDLLLMAEKEGSSGSIRDIQRLKQRVRNYMELADFSLGRFGFFRTIMVKLGIIKFEPIQFTECDSVIPRVDEHITESDLLDPENTSVLTDAGEKSLTNIKRPEGYADFKADLDKQTPQFIQMRLENLEDREEIERFFYYGYEKLKNEKESYVLMELLKNPNFVGEKKIIAHNLLEGH